ncbi:PKD domain-containing protein [Nostoc sp. CHAB 5834]|nr:PKD domain-containing protein [Nostoc sp. CHAB 5834]
MQLSFIQLLRPFSCLGILVLLLGTWCCKTAEVAKPAAPTTLFTTHNNGCTAPCSVSFNNQSQNATSYKWDFGDGNTTTLVSPVNTYQKVGNFTVVLSATGAGGITTANQMVIINAPAIPTVDFDIINNNCVVSCELSFINKSINAISYRWDFGDGSFTTDENPKHVYRSSGSFQVKLTATGLGGALSATKTVSIGTSSVSAVPSFLGLNSFYKKYIDAAGIPIVSSNKVPDAALIRARDIVIQMMAKRPDAIPRMITNKLRVAVMAQGELTLDIPEHSDLQAAFPGTDWNTRARGLGATLERPAASCAEENLLCYPNDPYRGEDILIHEFAHSAHIMGFRYVDTDFDKKLEGLYEEAKAKGLWANTYAMTNFYEYFAEGVQSWFNVNTEAIPTNGIHNQINKQAELKDYDPKLYQFIGQYFEENSAKVSCQDGK